MSVHRLTITGDPTFVGRIRDVVLAEHAAIIADDSWTVTEAGGVLEFSTTDLMMILNAPIVVMTFDVQVDAIDVADDLGLSAPRVPAPRSSSAASVSLLAK